MQINTYFYIILFHQIQQLMYKGTLITIVSYTICIVYLIGNTRSTVKNKENSIFNKTRQNNF